ncbi:carbon-nitrogen hydrolase family protein [Phaeovibrio sulfidiphilus]|uniref:Carbon-nitrogen hydrolase family protein n=1 Tax=Phaeovibrio sulfidiphilus TaxID=1220600 RepID=A0A8J7CCJ0_9PROT|nr:carbon-nitrogen hydrolase family protein [Phaeovibrio sulfidiphilus]MBE1237293.1 carbon-nitrogen hydrolase family protein [Phaeovibrio sulfidiphilus]
MTNGLPHSNACVAAPFVVGCVQMTSGRSLAANVDTIRLRVREAVSGGAQMVFLPENATLMDRNRDALLESIRREDDHPGVAALRQLARDTGTWIHTGSLAVLPEPSDQSETGIAPGEPPRALNRSLVLDPEGNIRARYDKIHLFDAALSGGEAYRESRTFAPGDSAVLLPTPFGTLGLSICYDLRFPTLYRALTQAGADMLAVPAAFTHTTGTVHWHPLLRARAIENGAWVIAAAQSGHHEDGRRTFGHSLIISPWGEIVADGGEGEGVILASIDPGQVLESRSRIPSLAHDRTFTVERL